MALPEHPCFSEIEKDLLSFWDNIDVFKTSLKYSKGRPEFKFYDGPPFATGLPHYGHILAGCVKDTVVRWAMQTGFHVERRFGWDCHGLPIEYEIDKALGIKSPTEIEKMGIANYNKECRNIAMKYSKEWEYLVKRLGRWIEFENDYKTLYPWFMESVWWVFKQLYVKGLVYRGIKVMPYSTACCTPLSNFEANQNYKEVSDPAVTVSFPLLSDPFTSLLAWTTTPWTLPSNLALCVHPDKTYVKIKETHSGKFFILMESRLKEILKDESSFSVVNRFLGKTLDGKRYTPLFDYFIESVPSAFRVLCDPYVTEESGTGVVHQAPFFGEDDYRICIANSVVTKTGPIVCPVDASGCFTAPVRHFEGLYVKEADKRIIKYLKDNNRLYSAGTMKHSYPFCWRSETPLIYKAVPCWFIRVENIVQQLLDNNDSTYWVPSFVKDKRFGNWLKDARDWCFSRNRFWGNPIPVWVSDDMEEVVCVGSIAELKRLANINSDITDIHRESIDHITIPSKRPGFPPLKRTPEVFDCWFESGSMPYAQVHYPFDNKCKFEENFPADFISEGIDQTRGWFYTLLVLSTALFNRPPFKNVLVTGLILAADGTKMSKRKRNYPDPTVIFDNYGSDALRLYLISSPAVKAEALKFKEEGVRDIHKDVFIPWFNSLRFLMQNIDRLKLEAGIDFKFDENVNARRLNIMDRWIISSVQSLIKFVREEMAAYRLYNVVPKLIKFIDTLTNWYIRMNRSRLRGETDIENCIDSVNTLCEVLYSMAHLMSPFTPFLSEFMYQHIRNLVLQCHDDRNKSIHYRMIPNPKLELIDTKIENAVAAMRDVIELGRTIRERKTLPLKLPLAEVIVVSDKQDKLDYIKELEFYIKKELNVRVLTVTNDRQKYGIQIKAEPDHKVLGVKARQNYKSLIPAIKNLKPSSIEQLVNNGELIVDGYKLIPEDIRCTFSVADADRYATDSYDDVIVLLDIVRDDNLNNEGKAREIINRIQKLRKEAKVVPTDVINVYCLVNPTDSSIYRIVESYSDFISANIRKPFIVNSACDGDVLIERNFDMYDASITITIGTPVQQLHNGFLTPKEKTKLTCNVRPVCKYVNVILLNDLPQRCGVCSNYGCIFLENPREEAALDYRSFFNEARLLFGLNNVEVLLYFDVDKTKVVPSEIDVSSLSGCNLFLSHPFRPVINFDEVVPNHHPVCSFVNLYLIENASLNLSKSACIFKENPCGNVILNYQTLCSQVMELFNLNPGGFLMFNDNDLKCKIDANTDFMLWNNHEIYVVRNGVND